MSGLYMLDTNTVSYIIKDQSREAQRRLAALGPDEDVCISAVTEAEIRYGLARRAVRAETREAIEQFLAEIEILPWDSAAACAYANLRAALERTGQVLGNMDLLIAAHSRAAGAVLVTTDLAFSRRPRDLEITRPVLPATVNWAKDVARQRNN